jgi:hypothetical protein
MIDGDCTDSATRRHANGIGELRRNDAAVDELGDDDDFAMDNRLKPTKVVNVAGRFRQRGKHTGQKTNSRCTSSRRHDEWTHHICYLLYRSDSSARRIHQSTPVGDMPTLRPQFACSLPKLLKLIFDARRRNDDEICSSDDVEGVQFERRKRLPVALVLRATRHLASGRRTRHNLQTTC